MRIRSALELEAKKTAYIDNALAMIEAQKAIVEQYLAGKLSLADEVPEPDVGPAGQRAAVVDLTRPRFNQQQRLFEQYALERLDLLEALRSAALPQDVEAAVERLEASNRPLLCLGGPGTGKTFVADYLIRLAVHREFKVRATCMSDASTAPKHCHRHMPRSISPVPPFVGGACVAHGVRCGGD